VLARVLDQRYEHRPAVTATAHGGVCRHSAHAPRSGRAVGRDEADGEQLLTAERAYRVSVVRLVRGDLLDALVRAQDRLAQGARLLDRDLLRPRQSASTVSRNVRPRFWRIGTASSST
jgi:hypothetical protein